MNKPMVEAVPDVTATVEILVPFHDVDLMGIVWHGHYVKYLEIARCALFDKIDYNYMAMRASGYAWPVIEVQIRYPGPARFEQKILVKATLAEWENRLKVKYLITDKLTGKRLTKAHTVQVAVNMQDNRMCMMSPPILASKLGLA